LTVYELLEESAEPSEDQIMDALGGQICRCTGYQPILAAVRLAAAKLQEGRATGAA
jgi:carbon-monoxide dehydrogenase small subunit